ncbi:hypothetical protein BKA70DRAFT_1565846 [Coprinopsis sp. MPI-PUGE-AT-0042]|nr:hypothetical protein BKA70DRAFT_1565846 [Coprinopsis sp. MPI-PUGE-AT-0042]
MPASTEGDAASTSSQGNIGFIIVISGTSTDKDTFCRLTTGAGFQSVYGTENSSSYGDHIRFSRPIPLSKLREASKPRNRSDVTAIQLLSVAEFSGGSGDVDVLISLASLVAALHMRAQPLLGVMFLHSLQVRLSRSSSLTLQNFGRLFLGSDPSKARSRFAFVAMNWLRDHPPNTLRGFLQKERELSGSLLGGIFPAEFGSSTPKAPIKLCGLDLGSFAYYRLSNRDTTEESSYQTILASFINGYAHRDLPLLYSELLDASNVDKGLSGTKIGAHLADVLSKAQPDEDEEFDDDVGQLDLDLLDEVACSQSSDLKLRSSKTRTRQVPYIEQALEVTRGESFVIVFGYRKDGNAPTRNTYRFRLLGIVVLVEEIQALSTEKVTHTLRMVSAICGNSNLARIVCIRAEEDSVHDGPHSRLLVLDTIQGCKADVKFVDGAFDEYCDRLNRLFSIPRQAPTPSLLESLALVKELYCEASLGATGAGQLVQQLLIHLLSENRAQLSKSHRTPQVLDDRSKVSISRGDVQALERRMLHLQMSWVALHEAYFVSPKLYFDIHPSVDYSIDYLEGVLLRTGDLRVGKDRACVALAELYRTRFNEHGRQEDGERSDALFSQAVRILDIQWEDIKAGGFVQGNGPFVMDEAGYTRRRLRAIQEAKRAGSSLASLGG